MRSQPHSNANKFSVEEYRKLTGDTVSSNEIIQKRIDFITALCSNVIRQELHSFMKLNKDKSD
jgi:hypothetical protein